MSKYVLAALLVTAAACLPNVEGDPSPAPVSSVSTALDVCDFGQPSALLGCGATAAGSYGTSIGYNTHAGNYYDVAIGSESKATGVGSVAIGRQVTTSASGAVGIGFVNTVSGVYSAALGSYLTVTGTGAVALGLNAAAIRPGELGHASGHSGAQGLRAIDLYNVLSTEGRLEDTSHKPLSAAPQSVMSLRVRLVASTTTGSKVGVDVHELLVRATNDTATIVGDNVLPSPSPLSSQDWCCTISASGLELNITCHPGSDTVRFLARAEWAELGNVN